MVKLTRINNSPIYVNSDLIEHIEANSDTVIALNNGQRLMVQETPAEIIEKIIDFRRAINEARTQLEYASGPRRVET